MRPGKFTYDYPRPAVTVDIVIVTRGADDAEEVGWFSLARPPKLAFDHKDILALARKHLKERHG